MCWCLICVCDTESPQANSTSHCMKGTLWLTASQFADKAPGHSVKKLSPGFPVLLKSLTAQKYLAQVGKTFTFLRFSPRRCMFHRTQKIWLSSATRYYKTIHGDKGQQKCNLRTLDWKTPLDRFVSVSYDRWGGFRSPKLLLIYLQWNLVMLWICFYLPVALHPPLIQWRFWNSRH